MPGGNTMGASRNWQRADVGHRLSTPSTRAGSSPVAPANVCRRCSMAVSDETRRKLRERAGGRCECTMSVCTHHTGRCPHGLHGSSWEAHHRSRGGGDHLGNLIAMCATCHKNTRTYGRPR